MYALLHGVHTSSVQCQPFQKTIYCDGGKKSQQPDGDFHLRFCQQLYFADVRHTGSDQDMAPYSEFAALMAQKPEAAILRRFQVLHTRITLLLHADLCNLEKDLDDIVQKARQPGSNAAGVLASENLDFEWKTIRDSQTPLAQEHRAKVEEIQQKLFMYCESTFTTRFIDAY